MKKKVLACVIVVVLALTIIGCSACSGNSFDKVVECAKILQSYMQGVTDFESFVIDDECGYKRGYDDYPFTVFIYIPFTTTYTDGDYWKDVAFFVGGDFIGFYTDYDDESYLKLSESDQILFLESMLMFLDDDVALDRYSAEEVMNAIAPAEEVPSGEQA